MRAVHTDAAGLRWVVTTVELVPGMMGECAYLDTPPPSHFAVTCNGFLTATPGDIDGLAAALPFPLTLLGEEELPRPRPTLRAVPQPA